MRSDRWFTAAAKLESVSDNNKARVDPDKRFANLVFVAIMVAWCVVGCSEPAERATAPAAESRPVVQGKGGNAGVSSSEEDAAAVTMPPAATPDPMPPLELNAALVASIEEWYPELRLPVIEDYPEARRDELSKAGEPWSARADFDGDGYEELAVLLVDSILHVTTVVIDRSSAGPHPVVLERGHAGGYYRLVVHALEAGTPPCLLREYLDGGVDAHFCWDGTAYVQLEAQAVPPSLVEQITAVYSDLRPLNGQDYPPEMRAGIDPANPPWVARGDFTGDGVQDTALLARNDGTGLLTLLAVDGALGTVMAADGDFGSGDFRIDVTANPDSGALCLERSVVLGGTTSFRYCWDGASYVRGEQTSMALAEETSDEVVPDAVHAGYREGFAAIVFGDDLAAISEKLDKMQRGTGPDRGAFKLEPQQDDYSASLVRRYLSPACAHRGGEPPASIEARHVSIAVEAEKTVRLDLLLSVNSDRPILYVTRVPETGDTSTAGTPEESAVYESLTRQYGRAELLERPPFEPAGRERAVWSACWAGERDAFYLVAWRDTTDAPSAGDTRLEVVAVDLAALGSR